MKYRGSVAGRTRWKIRSPIGGVGIATEGADRGFVGAITVALRSGRAPKYEFCRIVAQGKEAPIGRASHEVGKPIGAGGSVRLASTRPSSLTL